MRRAVWLLLAGLPALAQDKQESRVVLEDFGMLIFKPKTGKPDEDEKWKIQKDGDGAKLYKETQCIVRHRIDDLQIEFCISKKDDNQSFGELSKIADDLVANFEKDKDGKAIPDRKVKKRRSEKSAFPGAGGPTGWYVEIEVKDKDEVKLVVHMWIFIDKQNPNHLVRASVIASDDLFNLDPKAKVKPKYNKEINFVLSNVITQRAPRKK